MKEHEMNKEISINSQILTFLELPKTVAEKAFNKTKEDTKELLLKMGYSLEEINSTEKYRVSMLDYETDKKVSDLFFSRSYEGTYYIVTLQKL